jgi:heptosyltransferase-2
LGEQDFDLAIVLPNSPRSALEVWLARIQQRIGYARPWRNWFLTHAVPSWPGHVHKRKLSAREVHRLIRSTAVAGHQELSNTNHGPAAPKSVEGGSRSPFHPSSHQLYEFLHLVATLGASPEPLPPKLEVMDAEVRDADETFLHPIRDKAKDRSPGKMLFLLGLNPGAEYGPAKRWPAENFSAVVREVSRRIPNSAWLLFGGANDAKLCEGIERQAAGALTLNLAGKTSLRELMALLKLCRVLLTNDTGPMHVAAALATPVVVPFGSTSAELTGPGLPGDSRHLLLKSEAPCSPCFRRTCPIDFRCMTGITVPRVVEAVLQAGALV